MYKKKSKYLYALLAFMLVALVCIPAVMQLKPQAASKPGTVKLTKISSSAYNKINIKWKKTSGATHYIVYYKKNGAKKWTKIKTLDNTKSSYTHASSSKYPIVVGQKYQYTVKAYNSNTKKSGSYNSKGLTAYTIPSSITNLGARVLSNTVELTWTRGIGADKYVVYRKSSTDIEWNKIATVNGTYYLDKSPIANDTNYYTVRPYASKTKTYGKYDIEGIEVELREAVVTPNPQPTTKPQPTISPVSPKPTTAPQPTTKPQPTIAPRPTDKPQPTETPKPTATPTATPTPDPDEEPTPTPQPEPDANEMAMEVIRLTNVERAKYGLAPLQYHAGLQQAAMVRAREISVKFSHDRPDGRDCDTAISEAGVGCPSGENIAAGYHTPQIVVNAWMNSLGHKGAILDSTATHIGVGFYKSEKGVYYWVQDYSSNPDKKNTITCDANGGKFDNGQVISTFSFPSGMDITYSRDLPIPIRDGYKFSGWATGGGRVYEGIGSLTSNIKLTATWDKVE